MDAMDMSEGGGTATAAPEQNTVTLSAELLGGLAPKSGDKLMFNVTGEPDKDGSVSGFFEPPAAEGESWEDGFRKDMSPASPDQPQ